jgi:hypothetical protein
MTASPRNSDLVEQALAASDRLQTCLTESVTLLTTLRDSLSTGLQQPVEQPLNAPLTRDQILAAHRRSHRRGGIPKVASDPELELFILARVDTMTLKEIVAEVAANFPPERHVSVSCVNRWWLRTGKTLAASRP